MSAEGGEVRPFGRSVNFLMSDWTGWDRWRRLFPARWQMKWAAKKLLRACPSPEHCRALQVSTSGQQSCAGLCGPYKVFDFETTLLIIEAPWGKKYRILDHAGHCEEYHGPSGRRFL